MVQKIKKLRTYRPYIFKKMSTIKISDTQPLSPSKKTFPHSEIKLNLQHNTQP
jgi:hypothetical protein